MNAGQPITHHVMTSTEAGTGTQDRVAVVTGGATGIGLAVVRKLLQAGSRVATLDFEPMSDDTVADLEPGDRFRALQGDVRKQPDVQQARESLRERWSAPDLVIISAGVYRATQLNTDDPINWDELFEASFRGVIDTVRIFLPDLLAAADDGHLADLVVIGAIANESDAADSTLLASAAAASSRFVSGLRSKFQHRGLRVTHVAPGYVDTPMTRQDEESSPNAEAVQPTDVADIIVYALDQPADVAIGEMVLVTTKHGESSH